MNKPSSEPLVSVMMPCYNSRDTLAMAIASVMNQSYENWELVFVDDGSTDRSADFVESILDQRIRVFKMGDNRGRGYARQKAKEEAQGDFLAMLDSDDWYFSDKLEKQLYFMQEFPEIGLVGAGMIIVDSNHKAVGYRGCKHIDERINNMYKQRIEIAHAPSLLRKEVAKKIEYNTEMNRSQDVDFLARVMTKTRYANMPEPLYVYNTHNSYSYEINRDTYLCRKSNVTKIAKEFPINERVEDFKLRFNYALKRAGFYLGLEEQIIKRRNKKPSHEMLARYEREKATVSKIAQKLDN